VRSDTPPDFTSLYPFLYPTQGDQTSVVADVKTEVRASSIAKIREIIALRRRVVAQDAERLAACAEEMADRFAAGGRLIAFGNGGSSTDAQDLARLFLCPGRDRRALPAIGLTNDVAVVTALTNDVGFDVVFARQIGAFCRSCDIAVGLSTSGNSPNLLRAFDEAHRLGMLTVGLAGYDGGKMADLDSVDHLFVVSSPSVHRVQEAQTTIYHVLWELTVDALAGRDARACTTAARDDSGGELRD
jgi:D-sedoheptulose 7-phosphate isomerase